MPILYPIALTEYKGLGEVSMSNNDPGIQNIAADTAEQGGGIAGNGVLGGPPEPPIGPNIGNGVESVAPDDTGAATGAEDDPGYESIRPMGGSIDRDAGA